MILKSKKIKKGSSHWSSKFFYVFLAALALVIIGFLLDANFKLNKKRSELSTQKSYLEKELQKLEEQKRHYETQILRSQTNEFWEERLREQGYKKSGEEVLVVVPPEEAASEEIKTEKTFWQKLLEKLKLRD